MTTPHASPTPTTEPALRLVRLTSAQVLPTGPGREPLSEFPLISAPGLRTVYGDFVWDEESARRVNAAWAKRGRRFMWDYQHLSDRDGSDGKVAASVHDRRSAGNAAPPLADAGGVRLRDQRWTPDAARYIRNEEFLYYSPVIAVDKENRIVDIVKSSLTNDPATLNCQPISLSADEQDEVEAAAKADAKTSKPKDGANEAKDKAASKSDKSEDAPKSDDGEKPKRSATSDSETDPKVDPKAQDAASSDSDDAKPVDKPPPELVKVRDKDSEAAARAGLELAAKPSEQIEAAKAAWIAQMGEHPHGHAAKHEVSSVLVCRESDGATLWGRRHDTNLYTAPGGHLRAGERPVVGAARELREETGFDVQPGQLAYLGTVRTAHGKTGAPVDVHAYRLTVPDYLVPDATRDPSREVKAWEWMSAHPLAEMQHPRNALAILSAQTATGPLSASPSAPRSQSGSQIEGPAANTDAANTDRTIDMSTNATGTSQTNVNPELRRARSFTATLLVSLTAFAAGSASASPAGEVPADVRAKAAAAATSLKELEAAMVSAGIQPAEVDADRALKLTEVAMEVTGHKQIDGLAGALYSLEERAKAQATAVTLNAETASKLEIERGVRRGSIAPASKATWFKRIDEKRVSLSDCKTSADGPMIFDVPSTEAAPAGNNNTTVKLTDATTAQNGSSAPITSAPPAGTKTVELSAPHKQLVSNLERENGLKIDQAKVAENLTKLDSEGRVRQGGARAGTQNPGNG